MRHFRFQHLGFEPEPTKLPARLQARETQFASKSRSRHFASLPVTYSPTPRATTGHHRSPETRSRSFPPHFARSPANPHAGDLLSYGDIKVLLSSLFHLPSLVSSENNEEHRKEREATEEHRRQTHSHWRVEMVMRKRESHELLSG